MAVMTWLFLILALTPLSRGSRLHSFALLKTDRFKVGERVVVHGLTTGARYNGCSGTVKSEASKEGKHEVLLDAPHDKRVLIKAVNLEADEGDEGGASSSGGGEAAESAPAAPAFDGDYGALSIKQLKALLRAKGKDADVRGAMKSELVELVEMYVPEDEVGTLLAAEAAPPPDQEYMDGMQYMANLDADQLRQASSQMLNMDPVQMRRQVEAMRSMPPDQARQMIPQLAHMSDAQIRQAADQMEMMAANPDMMKMVAEQMASMSPDMLRQQMEMMKNMAPEQIEQMRKMSTDLMSGSMGAGGAPASPAKMAEMMKDMDPQKVLSEMDPEQLQDMMKKVKENLKENPEMIKNMMKGNPMFKGYDDEALSKQLDMLSNMDDEKLAMAVGVMKKFAKYTAPFRAVWSTLDAWTGGNAKNLVMATSVVFVAYGVKRFFGLTMVGGGDVDTTA